MTLQRCSGALSGVLLHCPPIPACSRRQDCVGSVPHRRRSRLSVSVQHAFLAQFVAGVPARTAAGVLGLSRSTVTFVRRKFSFQELSYQPGKMLGVFDLGPMTAAAKHVELGSLN
jgi:hypothetical protein